MEEKWEGGIKRKRNFITQMNYLKKTTEVDKEYLY